MGWFGWFWLPVSSSQPYYTSESNYHTTFIPFSEPLDAPGFTYVAVQDSALTLVFSDKALCSNSSWEVCIIDNSLNQTQHCSIQSAQGRLLTVDAGKGNVHSVKARILFGDRRSPYSETTTLGASVLPRGTSLAHHKYCTARCSPYAHAPM